MTRPRHDAQVAAAGADALAVAQTDVGVVGIRRRGAMKSQNASLPSITASGTPWWRISAREKRRSASDRSA